MYSGSHKFGRGGGGPRGGAVGGSKRKSFPPPPHRHPTPSSSSRISLGGGGGANSIHRTPPPPPPPQAADESFRLVGGEPLSLAAIIRLVPDLVPEIKRVEAQGGVVRIKFDSNPKNSGNVIDVGGKEYRFTWVNEKDCDIYEERQSGEDGNGLLVETGYAWRKLTTQRVLDESAKKQVKMRSLESEQIHKSRTTKVLDPGNPSMKSQLKELAAVDASPWKHKQKKDFQFKKKNFEPSRAISPAKPAHRPVLSAKGRHSNSPRPSPQNQYNPLASPSMRGSAAESRTIYDTTTEARAKENSGSPNVVLSPRVLASMHEEAPHMDGQGSKPLDLQQLLIRLLRDNSKGMSLKALEKAVGDAASGSARRIEPILKKIAIFEPSGRYILKARADLGNLKSSPEDNNQKPFVPANIYAEVPVPKSGLAGKSPADNMEEREPLNNNYDGEPNIVENFDPSQHLNDIFGDDEPPDHNEAQPVSSSNTDSDTDSASSDSGTNSASRSRSRSPAGSASGSDSEADSLSNSKETSDVEIDIMSDDDKEHRKLQDKVHELADKSMPWSIPEARADENNGDQDGYASEEVDIENDFLGDNEAELAKSHDRFMPTENNRTVSHDHDQQQTYVTTDVVSERQYDVDKFKRARSDSILNSENKSKRGSDVVHMEQNTDNVKRLKGRSLAQSSASVSGHMGSHTLESPLQTPPDMRNIDHRDNHRLQMATRLNENENANGNMGEERGYNYHVSGKSDVDSLKSSRRPPLRSHTSNTDKPPKNPVPFGLDANDQEMDAHAQDNSLKQGDADFIGGQDEDRSSSEKGNENGKFKESPFAQKSSVRPDPHSKHHSARSKKSHVPSARRITGLSTKDTVSAALDKSPSKPRRLQRELSVLEMGEFREPLIEEAEINRKQVDRVGSFKQAEAKLGTGSRNSDSKVNNSDQTQLDIVNTSPNLREVPRKPDSLSKRRSPEPYAEDSVRLQRGIQSQQQQSTSVRAEVESVSNKVVDLNNLANGEAFVNQGADVEGYGETRRKMNGDAPREDSQKEPEFHKGKGSKSRKSKTMRGGEEKKREVSVGRMDKRKRNEPSSDESASYSKYEKDEPELKGPIKSFSQYKEYVQEYRDKYDSYCSLNRILENYRNEFQKLGMDLESVKGRDMERYYGILAQLRESYRQCGTRHKRFKNIFIVLHEELKDLKQRIKDFAADYMRD
ncbi:hypothetical protein vseg_018346 [Gypsophila vaccaria]